MYDLRFTMYEGDSGKYIGCCDLPISSCISHLLMPTAWYFLARYAVLQERNAGEGERFTIYEGDSGKCIGCCDLPIS